MNREGFNLKLKKPRERVVSIQSGEPVAAAPVTTAPAPEPAAEEDTDSRYTYVTSPIVGTFYRSPNPKADPFAEVGDRVVKGQTLCIVEAMKLMNEIQADSSGVIAKYLVENGEGVEFGQKLIALETA